ncbi:hypothetical protein MUK42_24089 [Musa troglodytarum]|uniref:Uncharacterized protein n=2 Tax=Musa troglodytarum TaxID=320322 RepID=A0A9E7GPE2_9LILI|nr:hypothetical protein MUK42_24089 [Musa troglodytarum]
MHRSGAGKKKSSRRRGGMAWWDRVTSPMRRVWAGVAIRLGISKSGLTRLREEVSTCEYEDVHVLWELLTESGGRSGPLRAAAPRRARRRDGSHVWEWAGLSFCRRF